MSLRGCLENIRHLTSAVSCCVDAVLGTRISLFGTLARDAVQTTAPRYSLPLGTWCVIVFSVLR